MILQVASSTLDASAKIYAGRVDAIHSETYKVLTGLGRGSDKHEKGRAVVWLLFCCFDKSLTELAMFH